MRRHGAWSPARRGADAVRLELQAPFEAAGQPTRLAPHRA